jgi:hypothetical protein
VEVALHVLTLISQIRTPSTLSGRTSARWVRSACTPLELVLTLASVTSISPIVCARLLTACFIPGSHGIHQVSGNTITSSLLTIISEGEHATLCRSTLRECSQLWCGGYFGRGERHAAGGVRGPEVRDQRSAEHQSSGIW